jgi:hypothetical protein
MVVVSSVSVRRRRQCNANASTDSALFAVVALDAAADNVTVLEKDVVALDCWSTSSTKAVVVGRVVVVVVALSVMLRVSGTSVVVWLWLLAIPGVDVEIADMIVVVELMPVNAVVVGGVA